jgi:hypothetical protein
LKAFNISIVKDGKESLNTVDLKSFAKAMTFCFDVLGLEEKKNLDGILMAGTVRYAY